MRIRWRRGALAFALMAVVGTAAAPCVVACSCVPPGALADTIEPGTAVVVGRVGVPVGGRYPFVVERWFTGAQPAAVLTLEGAEQHFGDGQVVINTCGRSFQPNEHLILVGHQEGAQLLTSICGLGADVGTPEGRKLIREAEQLFGAGITPGGAGPAQPGPDDAPAGDRDLGLVPVVLLAAAGVGLGGLAVGSVVLLARQRRRGD